MTKLKNKIQLICLLLFLLSLAITLTINARWLYVIDVKQLDILDYVALSKSELMKNYDQLMTYLNFFWEKELQMTDFPVSESGALHFYEVKRLFQINYLVMFLTMVPSVLFLRNKKKTNTLWQLVKPFSFVLSGLIVLVFFMATAFDTFFVKFHEVFFNNDAWVFDPMTDPIIMVLPQDYFMHCFVLFFSLFVLFIIVFIVIGKLQFKKIQKNR